MRHPPTIPIQPCQQHPTPRQFLALFAFVLLLISPLGSSSLRSDPPSNHPTPSAASRQEQPAVLFNSSSASRSLLGSSASTLHHGFLASSKARTGSDPDHGQHDVFGDVADRVALSPMMAKMDDFVLPKGYPLEEHHVISTDGYTTVNFRIPKGRQGTPGDTARPGPPVLLVHGISLSSVCWVINRPDESLGFILADQGYDVWMTNTRGNTFSRQHTKYGIKDTRYWRFSMDEMALMDLPAVIRYILQVTGYKKVALVGHSQGGTLSYMMLSRLPEINPLVSVNVGLGPVAFVRLITAPNMVYFCKLGNVSYVLAAATPPSEYYIMGKPAHDLLFNGACQAPVMSSVCADIVVSLFGESKHIKGQQYRRYYQSWPSSTSYWNSKHWSQLYNEPQPRLRAFDYGPEYHLDQVKAPQVIVSGGADVLAPPEGVRLTKEAFRKAKSLADEVDISDYGHMDFIWDSEGARHLAYPAVFKALRRYNRK